MKSANILTVLIFFFLVSTGMAQNKYYTKSGKITFYSKAPLEDITASNKSVTCVLDSKTGNIQFSVLMKGFEFPKALMQEHFNENYVESDKYPKAEFKGQVMNNSEIDYTKDGSYDATVSGKLTIHGETNDVNTKGKIEIRNGKVSSESTFTIRIADYKITIPALVKDKISNTVSIHVECMMDVLAGS